ncbi:hypothetical protein [uncultured Paracoccus sp.]|uniref:hypothetical protein n=1 Tax=uncultured Paracoccus sp. TaxID=189685 RepID=UPI00260C0603|nr:hypothetical protein [uncultured Paracoccus sp.]
MWITPVTPAAHRFGERFTWLNSQWKLPAYPAHFWVEINIYAFLTCEPNAEVRAIHPKAMPVILTQPDDWTAWLNWAPASELQRPLPDGSLALLDEAQLT